MTNVNYNNWSINVDENGFCWLTLDRKGASANTLNAQVLQEFDSILDDLTAKPPKGLVIKSGKANGFIAGADIGEFMQLGSVTEATTMVL